MTARRTDAGSAAGQGRAAGEGAGEGARAARAARIRLIVEWLLALAIVASLSAWAAAARITERLDLQLLDIATSWTLDKAPNPRIAIVAIDDASLSAVGTWPWPRRFHADIVDRLAAAGADTIALDILFLERAPDPDDDAALAQSIATAGNVILPHTFVPAPNTQDGVVAALPIEALGRGAAGIGHVAAAFDADGSVRRLELTRTATDGATYPHLAIAIHEHAFGVVPRAALDGAATPIIPLRRAGSFPTIPASALLDGSIAPSALANRIVLVGASAQGLGDNYPVSGRAGGSMPGVEIQANLLDGLIAKRLVTPFEASVSALIAALVVLALFIGFWILRPRHTLAFAVLLAALVLCVAMLLPLAVGAWFAPGAALLGIVVAYPVWSWRRLVSVMAFLRREGRRLGAMAPEAGGSALAPTGFDAADRQMNRVSGLIDTIRRAEAERRAMLEFLSHDMRSPQVAILSLAKEGDGADGASLPPEHGDRLARIRHQAEHTLSLADGFVQLARVAQAPLRQETTDLTQLAAEAADRAWPAMRARGVTIRRDWGDDPVCARLDPGVIARALDNLLANAVRFSPQDGEIELSVESDAERGLAWLSVADTGPGLPPERQRDPFARFAGTDKGAGGPSVGLGLAFVGEAMARHDAPVHVESAPGAGARFTLEFALDSA